MAKPIPFDFVLEELAPLTPVTRPMFGCTSVYVGEKIVLILREKGREKGEIDRDDGVWLATTPEHHASLRNDFPTMRSIEVFGPGVTAWQVLPLDADDFEEAVLRACEFIRARDPRIGKIPKSKLIKGRKGSVKKIKKKKVDPKVAAKKTLTRSGAKKVTRKTKGGALRAPRRRHLSGRSSRSP